MEKYKLRSNITGYVTNEESTSAKAEKHLVAGSQNVLIDPRFGKFGARGGYSRLGAGDASLTPIRGAITWGNSTGGELPMRMYDDELEVYFGTVDGTDIDAWKRVKNSLSTTATPRFTTVWKDAETLDVLLYVQGDDDIHEWSGAVAVVASVTSNTITKAGTSTFAQNRFYTVANRTLINVRTGTEFAYTGGTGTTTLTGVTGDPTADGMVAGDILVQKVVVNTNAPAANRNNDTIFTHENQIYVGSDDDNEVYVSQNTSFTTFTYSTPRVSGEGGLLTLTGPSKGFGSLSKIAVAFAGKSDIFTVEFEQITVSTTLVETFKVRKLKSGVNQGCSSPETIVPIGDALIYLTNEPALRMLETVDQADQPQMKALSNPIKPDFDDEDWTNACALWHKNRYYLSSPVNSKLYILDYTEDANGRIERFWHPPQILPVRCLVVISGSLYGHSNSVPETYLLFNGTADGIYSGIAIEDKLPINAIAKLAYRTFGVRESLKTHDEFYIEGNISVSTDDLNLTLRYDFGGFTQELVKVIDGTNKDILYESLEATSLGQQPLGTQPIGGAVTEPPALSRFRVMFEMPKEDYHELQEIYETNGVDKAWEIIASGPNAKLSPRKNTINRL